MSFPGGSDGKASAYNAGDPGSVPGSRRSPGEGNGNPLQYSCLENPMDGGTWYATVCGVSKSWTRLSDFTSLHFTSLHFTVFPRIERARVAYLLSCQATEESRDRNSDGIMSSVEIQILNSIVRSKAKVKGSNIY